MWTRRKPRELDTIKQQIPPGQDLDQLLKTAGLTIDDVKKQIHEKVLISKVLEAEAFKNVEPTEQEIDEIYLAEQGQLQHPRENPRQPHPDPGGRQGVPGGQGGEEKGHRQGP